MKIKTLSITFITSFLLVGSLTASKPRDPVSMIRAAPAVLVEKNTRAESYTCPVGTVLVSGNFCPQVEQPCLAYDERVRNVNGLAKCDRFGPSRCLSSTRRHMSFCIDIYEYPNIKGTLPTVMVSWNELKKNCESRGQRLCTDREWTFACEGEEMRPYPYGYVRDSTRCNIDNDWIAPDEKKLINPRTRKEEVARLDRRRLSGDMEVCVSVFGVHDMTGNVDEACLNESGQPYQTALKGGHSSIGARNRCRPTTLAHSEDYIGYSMGGRCCSETNKKEITNE